MLVCNCVSYIPVERKRRMSHQWGVIFSRGVVLRRDSHWLHVHVWIIKIRSLRIWTARKPSIKLLDVVMDYSSSTSVGVSDVSKRQAAEDSTLLLDCWAGGSDLIRPSRGAKLEDDQTCSLTHRPLEFWVLRVKAEHAHYEELKLHSCVTNFWFGFKNRWEYRTKCIDMLLISQWKCWTGQIPTIMASVNRFNLPAAMRY